MSYAQTDPIVAVKYYSNAPHDSFSHSPCQQLHVDHLESPSSKQPRNHCNILLVYTAKALLAITPCTSFHCDPQQQLQQLVWSEHTKQSKSSIYFFYHVQKTRVHLIQGHVQPVRVGLKLCSSLGVHSLFFNPITDGVAINTKSALKTA